jgi:iron complex outermembrane receptor protein
VRHRYVGEVTTDKYILPKRAGGTVPDLTTLTNPKLPAQNYFDMSFSYDILENVQVYGGANNIADKDPPVLGSSSPSANTYAATYDVLGTTFFLGGKLKF